MSARAVFGTLAATVVVLTAAADLSARSPQPARLQVTADEFTLVLSRARVWTGPVVVELVNLGEDDHDLALRRLAPRARTFRVPLVEPGRLDELEARLAPGRYRLWCTLPGHRARGMVATLVVRKR